MFRKNVTLPMNGSAAGSSTATATPFKSDTRTRIHVLSRFLGAAFTHGNKEKEELRKLLTVFSEPLPDMRAEEDRLRKRLAEIRLPLDNVKEEKLITGMASAQEYMRRAEQICAEIATDKLSNYLFSLWAPTYDEDMAGHELAVKHLVLQALELNRLHFGNYTRPMDSRAGASRIFGKEILESSCGTGAIIKLLWENLPAEDRRRLRIIANDTDKEMTAEARKKLRLMEDGPHSIKFTNNDIRDFGIRHSFDTAVLSQTLHLISDPVLLEEERHLKKGDERDDDHSEMKLKVIRDMFDKLVFGDHFLLIDEWPAKISIKPTDLLSVVLSKLFGEIFRPLAHDSLVDLMKDIPSACWVAELKARIDGDHSMYMNIYRKDGDRVRLGGKSLPATGEIPGGFPRLTTARMQATRRIEEAFTAMDRHFRENFLPVNGERAGWVRYIPFGEGNRLEFDPREGMGVGCEFGGKRYGTIVLNRTLHMLDDSRRKELLEKAVNSLDLGGSLLIIDEWPAVPETSRFSTREFRNTTMKHFKQQLMFEGGLRETIVPGYDSGMYGYLYRKKAELPR